MTDKTISPRDIVLAVVADHPAGISRKGVTEECSQLKSKQVDNALASLRGNDEIELMDGGKGVVQLFAMVRKLPRVSDTPINKAPEVEVKKSLVVKDEPVFSQLPESLGNALENLEATVNRPHPVIESAATKLAVLNRLSGIVHPEIACWLDEIAGDIEGLL